MQTVTVNGVALSVTKNEARELARVAPLVALDRAYAERSVDVWLRSAPDAKAQVRRQAAAKALGFTGEIQYL